jgi:membrane-bound lytic murein transglycosylase D
MVLYIGFNLFQLGDYLPFNQDRLKYHIDALERFSFAGEPIPFNEKLKRKKFEAALNQIALNTTEMALLRRHAAIWFPILDPILAQHHIPADFKYIAVVESGLERKALSPRGAAGFWQIIASTGQELGLTVNASIDERYNPVKATHAVCTHFQVSKTYFGSWTNAAAAYNMGMTALIKACKKHKSNSYHDLRLSRESSQYLYKILAYKEILEHPQKYGIKMHRKKYTMQIKRITIRKSILNLEAFVARYHISYKTLQAYNPWIKQNALTITKATPVFELLIPVVLPKKIHKNTINPVPDSTFAMVKY